MTIGNAKIIADQRANAIIVLGNREVVVKVIKILLKSPPIGVVFVLPSVP